jgi:biotin carboxyl carrier protein
VAVNPIRVTLLGEIDSIMDEDQVALSLRKDVAADDATFEPPNPGRASAPRPSITEIRPLDQSPTERAQGARLYEVTVRGWILRYRVEDEARATLLERARRGGSAAKAHVRESIRARIPGRVTRIWVEAGQEVAAGERLLALEAMKMENEVRAPRAGTVVSIHVEPGQPVELNMELVTLD